jgi:HD-GYP domain-containing protein (c-di-GMP phosphodiesterase class II)
MKQTLQSEYIEPGQLRVGMFIELELGWMSHPFPRSSFKIASNDQIEVIHGLGLKLIRYIPSRSDTAMSGPSSTDPKLPPEPVSLPLSDSVNRPAMLRSELIASQQRRLQVCERRFGEANRLYLEVIERVSAQPQSALAQSHALINGLVDEMSNYGETAIRLLSSGQGDRSTTHPVNVTVIALLLGRALNLPQEDLCDLGMAALLHDMGKVKTGVRLRWLEEDPGTPEHQVYQAHVKQSVAQGTSMALPDKALRAMAEHHEMCDGTGFPAQLRGDQISLLGKVLALVNRYDNLCNPDQPVSNLTPHDALALIYTQFKSCFDERVLNTFVRMMGIYPPGSMIQLTDERYAMVVSVNASRPLKPSVLVYEPAVPRHAALVLDLEQSEATGLSIRRSLKQGQMGREVMDYLLPRQRYCYFFEQAIDPAVMEARA